jgi:hypothetical protein
MELETARLGEMSQISIRHGQNTIAYSKGLERAGFAAHQNGKGGNRAA